jgi:hypothetical protein
VNLTSHIRKEKEKEIENGIKKQRNDEYTKKRDVDEGRKRIRNWR